MSNTPTTTFGLLRHGETVWNTEKRIQGSSDSPLTKTGKKNIAQWLPTLHKYKWDRIIASPLPRVQQTVDILNVDLKIPLTYFPELREQDWGQWEGKKLHEISTHQSEELTRQQLSGWKFKPPGGESREEVLERVSGSLFQASLKWPGQQILVVSHQSVMKCILYSILGRKFLPHEKKSIKKNMFHLIQCDNKDMNIVETNIEQTKTK